MWLVNFNHLITEYLSCFFIISDTSIYKFNVVKVVVFVTLCKGFIAVMSFSSHLPFSNTIFFFDMKFLPFKHWYCDILWLIHNKNDINYRLTKIYYHCISSITVFENLQLDNWEYIYFFGMETWRHMKLWIHLWTFSRMNMTSSIQCNHCVNSITSHGP